jgi:hypothetical protein
VELSWECAFCDRDISVHYGDSRWFMGPPPREKAKARLLARVNDHIGFHEWQFGNEIDSMWLEEQGQEEE